jgi:hypothetical protein
MDGSLLGLLPSSSFKMRSTTVRHWSKRRKYVITPTIGRRVWFHPSGEQEGDQPLDAGIAYVHNDDLINISYSDKFGNMASAQQIQLWHGENEADRPIGEAYCEWMPYQRQQAEKSVPSDSKSKVADLLK